MRLSGFAERAGGGGRRAAELGEPGPAYSPPPELDDSIELLMSLINWLIWFSSLATASGAVGPAVGIGASEAVGVSDADEVDASVAAVSLGPELGPAEVAVALAVG